MIKKLTRKQEEQLAIYRDKWIKIGLSCEPCDFEKAKEAAKLCYRNVGLEEPKLFFLADSPISGALMVLMLKEILQVKKQDQVWAQVRDQVGAQVWDQVRDQVWAQVRDQVRDQVVDQVGDQVVDQVGAQVGDQVRDQVGAQVGAQVGDQVRDQVRAQVGDQVWAQVRDQVVDQVGAQVGDQVRDQVGAQVRDQVRDQVVDQVWDQVWAEVWDQVRDQVGDQVKAQVRDQVRAQVGDQVWAQVYGSHDSGWLAYYEFFREVLYLKRETEKILGLLNLAKVCGWWSPYQGICIFQNRHCEVHLNKDKRLHKDGGSAILYRDGFAVWALNGIRVSKEIAETDKNKLDSRIILTEKNAEVRREIVRKIGIEKVLKDLGSRTLDKVEDYELVVLNIKGIEGNGRRRPYLKMKNPSTGTWHIEGVHPDCTTVEKALNWRNGIDEKPIILT